VREGTAKQLTLFHPASGEVRVQGVPRCSNAVLHPWLTEQLLTLLDTLPAPAALLGAAENRRRWERWQEGLSVRITLPETLPPLRLLLVGDNLAGHLTPSLVRWLVAHAVMPLDTPRGGSWLTMAESIQRILKRRALDGQHPRTPAAIIAWLEAAARGWNTAPTPVVWGGARWARRRRGRERRRRLGGSGACTRIPIRHATLLQHWQTSCHTTH
jgi:hypothetical protein